MIETEEQRRWWFATHPEYSWSRNGKRSRKPDDEAEKSKRVSPEEVDAYVEQALKHARGSLADFLKIIGKWFGTEADSQKQDQPTTPAQGTGDQTGGSRPEDDPSYWAGYRAARNLIWNKEPLPPSDPNDNSPYALGFGQGVLDAYREAETAGKLWQAFQDTWDTLTSWLSWIGSSRTLGKNLEKAGSPKLDDHSSHHIVAETDRRADNARKILDQWGIKMDDAANGVRLPYKTGAGTGAYHPGVHTDDYYREVESLLRKATSKEDAIRILKDIGRRLSRGTFPK